MKIYPHLAEAIAITLELLRKEKNMSKSALADFSDVERGYVRGIEQGKRKPTVNTVYCMCDAMQIDPVDFFKKVGIALEKIKNEKTSKND